MNDKLKNLFLGHKNNEVISKIIENEIKFKYWLLIKNFIHL